MVIFESIYNERFWTCFGLYGCLLLKFNNIVKELLNLKQKIR